MPDRLAPTAPFSLCCRQQALDCIAAGEPVEQAAPHCRDPSRSPDPSTLRRWIHRRLFSLWLWMRLGVTGQGFFSAPTIVAWDFGAFWRTLPIEANSQ